MRNATAIQKAVGKAVRRDDVNAVSEAARPQTPQIVEGERRYHIALQSARAEIRRFAESRNQGRSRKPFVLPTKTPHPFAAHQHERFPHWLLAVYEGGQLAGRKAFRTLPVHGRDQYGAWRRRRGA